MIKITELDNGLKIITENIPDIRSATISVLVTAGSALENKKNNGLSHFVEHLLFKGTEKRSAKIIAQSIEDYGGTFNAFTEKEMTYYYAKVLTEQANLTVDIFCDMFRNSLFDREELELERSVILEEIKMSEDTPDELVVDLLIRSIWGESSMGLPVTGSYDSVQALSRLDITNYVNNYYTPDNIYFSISGNFNNDQLINTIKEHFGHLQPSFRSVNNIKTIMKPATVIYEKDIEQAHICIATKGMPILSNDRYALAAIDIALAGGISSRLFQEVREKRGLAYSIGSYKVMYRPAGVFGVYAATSQNNIKEVIKIIIDEFSKIRVNAITEDELTRAKKQLKGSLLLGLESTYYRSYRNVHSLVYFDKIFTIDEICTLIDAITMDDIRKVAGYMFDPDYYSLSIVGSKDIPREYSLKS